MDRSIQRLGVFLIALFVVLFAQLNYIQVFRSADLNEDPGNSRPVDLTFSIPRGTVSTADGVVVATSVKSNDRFEFQRTFPEGELYAALTGYFNYSFGAAGLESAYNEELSGRSAEQQIRSVGDLFTSKERTGNLELTVRSDVQAAAKAALGDRLGSVVALDPQTGGVLAAWSWPSYDPNKLSTHDLEAAQFAKAAYERDARKPLLAKSYREIYFPGSTFKVVTASTALEAGKVTVDAPTYPVLTALDVPQTSKDLRNFGGSSCGGTLFAITSASCNTAYAQMGLDLGNTLTDGAERFGFNQRPPLDLPAVASTFPTGSFDKRLPVLAQAAIGQNDVAASPLQMALVAGAIANDGVIMEPHVVDEVRDNDNSVIRKIEPTQWKRATSPQTADIMRQAMRQVVGPGGTATRLQIAGLDVGAKTGTAQLGNGTSHAWVIAWAGPVGQKPTVAVAVLVQAQPGASEQTGGRVAAPIAKAVIEAAMKPLPAPPAEPGASTTTSTTTPAGGN